MSRTYHNLSAGSTTILPSGKVLRFGGSVQQVEGGTRVGLGTYTTDDPLEIEWLDSLCVQQTPQVWLEVPEAVMEVPAAVNAGVVADTEKVTKDVVASAERAVKPEIAVLLDKIGSIQAGDSTGKN